MKLDARLVAALLVAAALVACGVEPRFPHRAHLETSQCGGPGQAPCPSCATCHRVAPHASPAPAANLCARCHAPGGALPTSPSWRRSAPDPERAPIRFDHAAHVALPDFRGQCVKCHAGVVATAAERAAGATPLPPMARCFEGCHGGDVAKSDCASCHGRGLARTVPRTFLRHDQAFMRSHGTLAASLGAVCARCHAASECASCHDATQPTPLEVRFPERIDRELIHRADFVARHAFEAKASPATCLRCHQPSSCDGCHVERGVSGQSPGAASPHPIGWIGPDTSSPTFHGRHARRDIVSCAACHDQGPATNCIRCHKVGGSGGNPHPSGWRSQRSPSDATCRYCHER
jgi:hypothetical protein